MLNADQRQKLAEVYAAIDTQHIQTKSEGTYSANVWTSEKIEELKRGIETVADIESGKFWAKTLLVAKGLDGMTERIKLIGDLTSAISYSVAYHIKENSEYKLWQILDEEALLLFCTEVVRAKVTRSFIDNGL